MTNRIPHKTNEDRDTLLHILKILQDWQSNLSDEITFEKK